MKHYAVAELNITNPAWVVEYADKVTRMVENLGGKYLSRTGDIEVLEGESTAGMISLIIEFPSKTAAEEFYNSEEYRPFLSARQSGSTGKFLLVAGKDDTGQATIA